MPTIDFDDPDISMPNSTLSVAVSFEVLGTGYGGTLQDVCVHKFFLADRSGWLPVESTNFDGLQRFDVLARNSPIEVASRWLDDIDGGIFPFERSKTETSAKTFDLAPVAKTWILVAKFGALHIGGCIERARSFFYGAEQRRTGLALNNRAIWRDAELRTSRQAILETIFGDGIVIQEYLEYLMPITVKTTSHYRPYSTTRHKRLTMFCAP